MDGKFAGHTNSGKNDSGKDAKHQKARDLLEDLDSLVVTCPSKKRRPAIYQQTGLQLYKRLSRTEENMVALLEDVRQDVAAAQETQKMEADALLLEKHREADRRWREESDNCYIRLKADAFRVEEKRKEYETRYSDAIRKMFFCPILSHEVADILHLSENTASQYLRRYRLDLENILKNYYRRFENFIQENSETEEDEEND